MIHEILKKYWGHDTFRSLQKEIIQAVLAGNDTLALLPTGGGKSICFQVPALAMEGLCLVISPLIALMKDQVEALKKREIKAEAIYSGMDKREIDRILDKAVNQELKFLYVSPERLKTELMLERAKRMKISLLAIDEAHCISQWGYDFRPPYSEIAKFRKLIPKAALIALTATATEVVKADIQEKLHFKSNKQIFQKSFARANLSYSCFEEEDKEGKLIAILKNVPGTAVVYVRNRKRCKAIAEKLQKNQISADFYHAGLSHQQRANKQEAWINNKTRVIVATNAFGMGIDKANVRSVVHIDLPDSLEAYYQEAGRAGRDEKKAYAVALYTQADIKDLEKKVLLSYPEPDFIRKVYQALANYLNIAVNAGEMYSYDFDLADFQKNFNLENIQTYYALKKLEEEGFIQFNESFYNPSKILFTLPYRELYEFQLKNPQIEPLIKLLLRFYGGELHSNFISISENTLARHIKINTGDLVKQLEQLQERNVLLYTKQKDKAQIILLTPRFDAKNLPLDIQKIEARKQRDLEKVKAVANYAQHQNRCRTQILLEYFGEISYRDCGVCDICLAKKRKANAENKYSEQSSQILTILSKEPLLLKNLLEKLKPLNEKQILSIIQEMIKFEQVKYLKDGRIALK